MKSNFQIQFSNPIIKSNIQIQSSNPTFKSNFQVQFSSMIIRNSFLSAMSLPRTSKDLNSCPLPSFLPSFSIEKQSWNLPKKSSQESSKKTLQKILQKKKKESRKKSKKFPKNFSKSNENIQFPTSHMEAEDPFGLVQV